ncbi:MAG: cation transporter [Lachnospiraceae bacterium]|nr:cation transporter [Lachnospiraceae bacterium]
MTQLLLRLFIKDHQNTCDPHVRSAVGKLSGIVGIICNLILFTGKIIIGTISGAVSITADAMNNLSDATSSIITLLGFKLAEQPADEKHPYGHARFEYLSGLAVAALIVLIGFELAKSSINKIINPAPVEFSLALVIVLVLSILLKLWMCLFNRTTGRMINSSTLLATSADSRNDVITTAAVLLASIIETTTKLPVDGFFGLGVSLFILYSGANLAKETISPLLGESASPELQALIVDYISAHPKVLGYHDLMVHDYGPGQRFATIHVEMDQKEDPLTCHEIIDDMERECLKSHNIHLVIHYDPIVTDDPELSRLHALVDQLLTDIDPELHTHDFRMVRAKDFTNLIFDVTLPEHLKKEEKSIKHQLDEKLSLLEETTYYTVITFDQPVFNRNCSGT